MYPIEFEESSQFTIGSKYLNLSLSLTEGVHCVFSGCYIRNEFRCISGYQYFPAKVTCPGTNSISHALVTDYVHFLFLVLSSTSVTRSIISTPHRVPHSRTSRILVTSSQQWLSSSADHMTKYSVLPTFTAALVPTQGTIGDSNKGDSV